jgi:integrase
MRLFDYTPNSGNTVLTRSVTSREHMAHASPWESYPPVMLELIENTPNPTEAWAVVHRLAVPAYAAAFAIVFALRASEVLALTVGDILANGSICVKSKKHGRTHVLSLPKSTWRVGVLTEWQKATPLFATSYPRMYRAAVELGWSVRIPGYSKKIVTHLGRHTLANQLMQSGFGSEVSDSLNHNSHGAAAWYKKEADLVKDRNRKRAERSKKNVG